jgi:hypothetical protein
MRYKVLDDARARATALDELPQTGNTHGNERKLHCRKKCIDADQRQDGEKANQNHLAILTAMHRRPQ